MTIAVLSRELTVMHESRSSEIAREKDMDIDVEGLILIHPEKCTGCRTCEMICSFVKTETFSPYRSRVRILKIEEEGIDLPMMCLQCTDPICSDACPVGAIWKEEGGLVKLDPSLCRGCHACMLVCPFGAISIDDEGYMVKCDLCGGDPQCVNWCETKALEFRRPELARTSLMDKRSERILRSLQGRKR